MQAIFGLLLLLLGIGLFARRYNTWTRLLVSAVIIGAILLLYKT